MAKKGAKPSTAMPKAQITVRLDMELKQKVIEEASLLETSMTEFVAGLIKNYFKSIE